ncbi:MAG: hypothetical protein JW706_09985 [Opitutales bacterium]|nr:hypothetical protein [Opitutales bacterium]
MRLVGMLPPVLDELERLIEEIRDQRVPQLIWLLERDETFVFGRTLEQAAWIFEEAAQIESEFNSIPAWSETTDAVVGRLAWISLQECNGIPPDALFMGRQGFRQHAVTIQQVIQRGV